ncbi:MAG: VOC family protein [Clostridiales bacterium]|nr:VOC family protein [Clostridiales bacterium]
MKLITGTHHISLKPADRASFEETLHFYRDLLELELLHRWDRPDGSGFAMLSTGNSLLEVVEGGAPDKAPVGSIDHFALSTTQVDVLVERVQAAGYDITLAPRDGALGTTPPTPIRIAFCRGPIGELIEFFHEKQADVQGG